MYIPVILGTAREGRQSENVANFIVKEATKFGFESEVVDVKDYRINETDNTVESDTAKKWAERAERADGFIIVSPEYNHGYPGELKMFLDMLYEHYNRKPVGIVGVSAGPFGGSRMMQQLILTLVEFQMVPLRAALYFGTVQDLFDEDGNIKDEETYQRRAKDFFQELEWYAKTLKEGRKNGD